MKKLLYASVSAVFLVLCCSENMRAMEESMTVSVTEDSENNKKAATGMWAYLDDSGVLDFVQKHNLKPKAAAAVIASALAGFVWYAAKKVARVPTARTGAPAGAVAQAAAQRMVDSIADSSAIQEAARATGSGLARVEAMAAGDVQGNFANPLLQALQEAKESLTHVEVSEREFRGALPSGAVWPIGGRPG